MTNVTYRLFDFSSDQGIEAEAATPEAALVELGRALAHVITSGSKIEPKRTIEFAIEAPEAWSDAAVSFLNELVYRFDTEQFLVASGELRATPPKDGARTLMARLRGETFDPTRHEAGRGVKAATHHDASHATVQGAHRLRVVLDL